MVCPSNQTVAEGSDIILRCSAKTDAGSNPIISWEKDGKTLKLTDAGVYFRRIGSVHLLTIYYSNRWHAGKYKCVARNNNTGAEEACPEARVVVDCKYSMQMESSSVGMGRGL